MLLFAFICIQHCKEMQNLHLFSFCLLSSSFLVGLLDNTRKQNEKLWDVTLIFLFAGFGSTRFEIKISLLKNAHLHTPSLCGKEVY